MPFLSSFFFAYFLISKQRRKVNVHKILPRISFVIDPPPPPVFLSGHLKSLDKRCEVMDIIIIITYGCTKTYFYMSEI